MQIAFHYHRHRPGITEIVVTTRYNRKSFVYPSKKANVIAFSHIKARGNKFDLAVKQPRLALGHH